MYVCMSFTVQIISYEKIKEHVTDYAISKCITYYI